jgi:uncharacterized protein YjbJ (UPF0337 family)
VSPERPASAPAEAGKSTVTHTTKEMHAVGDDLDKTKGHIKEAAGDLTGDADLKREGKVDRAAGGFKEKVGDAADTVKDALHKD